MIAALVGLLLTGSFAVCLDRTEGLDDPQVGRVLELFSHRVEARMKTRPEVDREGCARHPSAIRLQLFGGPARILVLAERVAPAERSQRSRTELDRADESTWPKALDTIAAEVLPWTPPEPTKLLEVTLGPPPTETHSSSGVWSWYAGWTAIALGVVGAGVGLGFAVSAASPSGELPSGFYGAMELEAGGGHLQRDLDLAAAFSVAGIGSLVTGALLLAFGSTP